MSVDLSEASEGLLTLANGDAGHTFWERMDNGNYRVRYEHGWWYEYTQDGNRVDKSGLGSRRDIVEVKDCKWDASMRSGFSP